jgi:S-adenosylmethionine uptake transporter
MFVPEKVVSQERFASHVRLRPREVAPRSAGWRFPIMIARLIESRAPRMAGILLSVAAYFTFSFQDAVVKWLVVDHAVPQILFIRSVAIFLLCLAIGRFRLLREVVASRNKLPLLLRGGVMLGAWLCYYSAARYLQLAELVTIYFAAPLMVTILSVWLLRERVSWQRWVAVALGFVGVIVACDPSRVGITVPVALTLVAALLWAYSNILVRQISRFETTMMQMLFSSAAFAVACGLMLPWLWTPMSPAEFAMMALLGLFGALGQYLLLEGFRLAAASLIAPLEYTSLVWAFGLSYLIWHDIPGINVFLGAGLIIASGLLLVVGEWRAGRQSPRLASNSCPGE